MSGWRKVGDLVLLLSRPQVEIEIIKIVQLITKRKKLSGQRIANFFKNLNSVYFVLKSAQEIKTKRKLSAQRIVKLFKGF